MLHIPKAAKIDKIFDLLLNAEREKEGHAQRHHPHLTKVPGKASNGRVEDHGPFQPPPAPLPPKDRTNVPNTSSYLYAEPITGIPTSRLGRTDNLDDLTALETQVPGDGVLLQDTRQLCLLEAVSAEQRGLFVAGEEDVGGDELVVGDVDEEVLLEEAFDAGKVLDGHEALAGRGGQGGVGDHDAGLVVVADDVGQELADAGHAEGLVGDELDPDGAHVGDGFGVLRRRRGGVLLDGFF